MNGTSYLYLIIKWIKLISYLSVFQSLGKTKNVKRQKDGHTFAAWSVSIRKINLLQTNENQTTKRVNFSNNCKTLAEYENKFQPSYNIENYINLSF